MVSQKIITARFVMVIVLSSLVGETHIGRRIGHASRVEGDIYPDRLPLTYLIGYVTKFVKS